MIKFTNYFPQIKINSEIVRNLLTLVTGSGVSQIIPILCAPLIARLYNPNDYAVMAAYSSISVLLTIIATGMYDSALMLDNTDNNAINTGAAAVIVTLVISFLSAIVVFLFRDSLAILTGNKNVAFWLYLLPLTVFFFGSYQTLSVWNNRKKRFKRLSINKIILSITTASLTLAFGFYGFREKGLLISLILQAFSFLLLLIQTINSDYSLFKSISKSSILSSFYRHQDFPKYNMPQGLLDGAKESLILIIISNYFSATIVGSYYFATNILLKPLQIIGGAVGQVFYPFASNIYNQTHNIYKVSRSTFLSLFISGLPFVLIILFFGEYIFKFIFSAKWNDAGVFAQILIVYLFLRFIASPLSTIPLILQKQKSFFHWSLVANSLPIIVLYFSAIYGLSIYISLICFVIINIFLLTYLFKWLNSITLKG